MLRHKDQTIELCRLTIPKKTNPMLTKKFAYLSTRVDQVLIVLIQIEHRIYENVYILYLKYIEIELLAEIHKFNAQLVTSLVY